MRGFARPGALSSCTTYAWIRPTRRSIELHYVCVDSPDQTLHRIRNRVALGGHDVPEPDVRRRFARSLAHLPAAIARSDEARLYDNTDSDHPHREIAILNGATRWTAERLPGWATAALDRLSGS